MSLWMLNLRVYRWWMWFSGPPILTSWLRRVWSWPTTSPLPASALPAGRRFSRDGTRYDQASSRHLHTHTKNLYWLTRCLMLACRRHPQPIEPLNTCHIKQTFTPPVAEGPFILGTELFNRMDLDEVSPYTVHCIHTPNKLRCGHSCRFAFRHMMSMFMMDLFLFLMQTELRICNKWIHTLMKEEKSLLN